MDVKYLVKPGGNGRWEVMRGGKFTGSFALGANTAIGIAKAMASQEAKQTELKVTVWLAAKTGPKKIWP